MGYFTAFTGPPELFFSNLFPSINAPSSSVKWESHRGGRGLAPLVAPGAPAPVTHPLGIAQHAAEAAYWKEKMYFDEEFLNNLRQPGTNETYMTAARKVASELAQLGNRNKRRKEWMFSQMFFNNGFTYEVAAGYKVRLDYGVPSDHRVTLASSYNWDTGASKNILKDIQDGKQKIQDDCGANVTHAIFNSSVLKLLANDTTIRDILKQANFGAGLGNLYTGSLHDIVGVNPQVLGKLLDIPNFICWDGLYEIRAYLTSAVTGGSTSWFSVDDVSDLAVGNKIRFWDASAGTFEDSYIKSIDIESSAVQVSKVPASSYKPGEDYITMPRKFIPDDKFLMFANSVDGQPIGMYMQAPFGLGRHYGMFPDQKEEWDPEGLWIRVQDKGLPILVQRDALYSLDVVSTYAETLTSTSTTTSSTSSSTTTTTTAP
jgi:hypothetical protein